MKKILVLALLYSILIVIGCNEFSNVQYVKKEIYFNGNVVVEYIQQLEQEKKDDVIEGEVSSREKEKT